MVGDRDSKGMVGLGRVEGHPSGLPFSWEPLVEHCDLSICPTLSPTFQPLVLLVMKRCLHSGVVRPKKPFLIVDARSGRPCLTS